MRHLMSPLDFSVEELDKLLDLANDIEADRKSTRLNSSHPPESRMPSSA